MHVLVSTINTARWGVRLRKSLLGRSYEIRKTPPADVMDAARQGIALYQAQRLMTDRASQPARRIGMRAPLRKVNTAARCSLMTSSNVWRSRVAMKLRRASFSTDLSVQAGSNGQS